LYWIHVGFASNVKNCLLFCCLSGSCHVEVWVTIEINLNSIYLIKWIRLFNPNLLILCWVRDKFVGCDKNYQPYMQGPNTSLIPFDIWEKNGHTKKPNERSGWNLYVPLANLFLLLINSLLVWLFPTSYAWFKHLCK
jgi:hypothetical protein